MCQIDTWYIFDHGRCINPVAHIVLCALLIPGSLFCIIKGFLALPQLVHRAKQILGFYIATQITAILLEIFGLIIFKIDSTGLRLFRFFLFSTLSLLQYWGIVLRTEFFLETVASTQQYKGGLWTLMKCILGIFWLIYSIFNYILLIILPGTLPHASQRELCVRVAAGAGAILQFLTMLITALAGSRLLAVIRTVVELGLSQPARLAMAKENMMILRKGLTKTMVTLVGVVVVSIIVAFIGMYWVIVHFMVLSSQVGFLAALTYLQTCKTTGSKQMSKHTSKSGKSFRGHNKVPTLGDIHPPRSEKEKESTDEPASKPSNNGPVSSDPFHDHDQSQGASSVREEKGGGGGETVSGDIMNQLSGEERHIANYRVNQ